MESGTQEDLDRSVEELQEEPVAVELLTEVDESLDHVRMTREWLCMTW